MTSSPATARRPDVPARRGRRVPGGRSPTRNRATSRTVTVQPGVHPRCQELLADHPVLLVERISGLSGVEVNTQAVDGIFTAAGLLATDGVDFLPVLERYGKKRLLHELDTHAIRSEPVLSSDGKPIRHRLLFLEDLAPQGLLLALVTGTGTQTDDDFRGPAMDWLADRVLEHTPAILYAREWERWGRESWSFRSLSRALRTLTRSLGHPIFGGDRENRLQPLDEEFETILFLAGRRGRVGAAGQQARAAEGSAQKTGTQMVDGHVPFGTHVTAPPGMAKAQVRPGAFDRPGPDTARRRGHHPAEAPAFHLYIDEPGSRPDPHLVIASRADVGRGGQPPVDQAAHVRWFLSTFGTVDPDGTEWDLRRCAAHLAAGKYVTDGLRRRHGQPDPTWVLGGPTPWYTRTRAAALCNSILNRLDEYHSGVFTFSLVGGKQRRTITGVLPACGRWMTDEDYARITAYRASRATRVTRQGVRVFAGFEVRFNGRKAVLQASNHGEVRYYFARRVDKGTLQRLGTRNTPIPPLPQGFLVDLLVEGLSDGGQLPRVVRQQRTELNDLETEVAGLTAEIEGLEADNAATRQAVQHPDITDRLRKDLDTEYNERASVIEHQKKKVHVATSRLQAKQAAARAARLEGVEDANLLQLVAALVDPRSRVARSLLKGSLSLDVRSSRIIERDRPAVTVLTVKGSLLVHNDLGTWRVPLHGAHVARPRAQVAQRVAAAVDGLRDGRPLSQTLGSDWRRWLPLIRDALGLDQQPFRFGSCDDQRLLKLNVAVIHPPATDEGPDPNRPRLADPPLERHQLPALARQTGEPLPLLQRIHDQYTRPATQPRLLFDNSTVAVAAFRLASRNGTVRLASLPSPEQARTILANGPFGGEWVFGRGSASLAPCPGCGGTSRIPLRLREATGSICRTCRTDRAEVPWPTSYDRYGHHEAQPAIARPAASGTGASGDRA